MQGDKPRRPSVELTLTRALDRMGCIACRANASVGSCACVYAAVRQRAVVHEPSHWSGCAFTQSMRHF